MNNTAEVLVVGGGPAGLAASLTLASEGRSVILLEKQDQAGGQAGTSALIENVPPFADGFSGSHFTDACCRQCQKFGVQIECGTEVRAIIPNCSAYTVLTNNGPYHGRAVLLALGLQHRSLGVPGEDLPGIHYGMRMNAVECPSDARVVLIGGGNSVGQAALYYLGEGSRVAVVARRPIEETMSAYLVKRIKPWIDVIQSEVTAFESTCGVLLVRLKHPPLVNVTCVHIFVGQEPRTEWLTGLVKMDEHGYILTDNEHSTSHRGLFAVGDVVRDSVRRVACAIGYGNEVVPAIHRYLDSLEQGQVGCGAA